MAKAKIKIKVSDSGIVTLAASGDGYATLNALVEVLAATICEASPNWDFAEIMTDAAVNRLYDLVDDGTRKKVIRRGEWQCNNHQCEHMPRVQVQHRWRSYHRGRHYMHVRHVQTHFRH